MLFRSVIILKDISNSRPCHILFYIVFYLLNLPFAAVLGSFLSSVFGASFLTSFSALSCVVAGVCVSSVVSFVSGVSTAAFSAAVFLTSSVFGVVLVFHIIVYIKKLKLTFFLESTGGRFPVLPVNS